MENVANKRRRAATKMEKEYERQFAGIAANRKKVMVGK